MSSSANTGDHVETPRLRLCMILHATFPGEVRVAAETRAAVAAGIEVDIISLRLSGQSRVAAVDGATCYRLPLSHKQGGGIVRSLWEYFAFTLLATGKAAQLTLANPYDVVQVHNPPDFLILAALPARLRGASVILDVHDLASDMFEMRFGTRPGAGFADRILRLMERTAGALSDRVLTVHEPYREELIARGIARDKTEVILNSLDESLLPTENEIVKSDRFRVVYHGTITPNYGVDILVDAVAASVEDIPSLELCLYGEGDARQPALDAARRLGVLDRVHAPGLLSQREVVSAISSACVGVVPNRPTRLNRFALSTKLFEYVALNIPVVTADLPTIRRYFSDDEVMFFKPGDARDLARALTRIALDPEAARIRAVAARQRYEEYRWPQMAARYVSLLRSAAANSRRPRAA